MCCKILQIQYDWGQSKLKLKLLFFCTDLNMDVISKGFTLHKSSYWICKILQHIEKLTQLVLMRFYWLLKHESSENMSILLMFYPGNKPLMSCLYYDVYVVKTSLAYPGYETKWRWRAGGLKNIIHGPYKLNIKIILLQRTWKSRWCPL
jgi:hypothetical protein